uniref:Tenascin-like n=1 Tax=Crassostrea virginica TaxID=6565 RepID=A0A8B8AZ37_CRAVI|nr:tenascin-like [Crassostrea virginica]
MATLLRIQYPYCDKDCLNLVSAFVLVWIIQNIQCTNYVATFHCFRERHCEFTATDIIQGGYSIEREEFNMLDLCGDDSGNRRINEKCYLQEQCTGTENENNYRFVSQESKVCSCDDQFELIGGKCLKGERRLFEPCKNDLQCNGTVNAGTCRKVSRHSFCFCNEGHIEYQGRCVKVTRRLNESCEAHLQCNGSKHAGVCGENKTCTCDEGFIKIKKECLLGNLSLGQSCEDDIQCKGTENAGRCLNSECFCEEGFVLQRLKCYPASRRLNESCEVHLQCNGSRNAGVCGENKTCTCDKGFIKLQEECITEGSSYWIMETEKQLLLVVGGLFIIVVALLIAVLVEQKKRSEKSSQMEPARKQENSYEEEIDEEIIPTQAVRMQKVSASYYSEPIEPNYNNLHQKEDDKESRSGNVYDRAQPTHSNRNDEFQTDSSLYNHLHDKPFQLSADIYDKPEGIPMSSLSTNQNNTKL